MLAWLSSPSVSRSTISLPTLVSSKKRGGLLAETALTIIITIIIITVIIITVIMVSLPSLAQVTSCHLLGYAVFILLLSLISEIEDKMLNEGRRCHSSAISFKPNIWVGNTFNILVYNIHQQWFMILKIIKLDKRHGDVSRSWSGARLSHGRCGVTLLQTLPHSYQDCHSHVVTLSYQVSCHTVFT